MKDGFVSVAAITPPVKVADVGYNVGALINAITNTANKGAKLIVTPELGITAYTCEDLFLQASLLEAAQHGLKQVAEATVGLDALIIVGVPMRVAGKLYNCAAVLDGGKLLGLVPKQTIPTYNEFYEGRHFSPGPSQVSQIEVAGFGSVPFGANQLFTCDTMPDLVVAVELCEDLWAPDPPSIHHAVAGATVVCNLSASNALVGKASYRRMLVLGQSARLVCGYLYASAGPGESTQDLVFSQHNMIAENGTMRAEAEPFGSGQTISELDVSYLLEERQRLSTFHTAVTPETAGYVVTPFHLELTHTHLTRSVDPAPFVPDNEETRDERCEDILMIQSQGLAKRLRHTHSTCAVVGVSGGLDSTLALLVTVQAFDAVGLDRSRIIAVTMPGFGTTKRTRSNAEELAKSLGVTLREVDITKAVQQHFADIGHDESVHDVTYENAQARERTQVLMDIANQEGGLVVGTGDLSELALGWATYNGDHMSMYGVNASVPKTLVRHLVHYVADNCGNEVEASILMDVLDTPVSPELLPATANGTIAQKTEDLVGPYELHDFFLYYMLRLGFAPHKVFRLAVHALGDEFDPVVILKWLKVFYHRFFAQQFKRSCLPDGPKVGSVAVSPRGDLRMPSDAMAQLWLEELDQIDPEGYEA